MIVDIREPIEFSFQAQFGLKILSYSQSKYLDID